MSRKPHLLAVSWCLPPGLFPRSIQVARLLKGLSALGWTSSVITAAPGSRLASDPADPALAQAYGDYYRPVPVDLSRLDPDEGPWWPRLAQRLRGDEDLTRDELWMRRAESAARHYLRVQRTDALVTFAQPWSDHRIGLAVSQWQPKVAWVAHFSDPWVDSLYDADQPSAVKDAERATEARVVATATAIVFTNDHARQLVMKKYPRALHAKAHVVPHTMDRAQMPVAVPPPAAGRPLRLAHVGNLFAGRRRAHAVFEALALLHQRRSLAGRIEFVLVGEGSGLYEARQRVFELALEPLVTFQGRTGHFESLAAMASSDALLLIDAAAASNVFMPSKLVDYVMAGRPILALTPAIGSSAEILRSFGQTIVDPDDVGGIAGAISGLIDLHEAGGVPPASHGEAAATQFGLESTSRAFAAILDQARRRIL